MAYQFTQTGAEIQDILDLAQLQIAAPYDSGTSYVKGDYCTKDDGFYVCTASTSGTWDGSKWSAVTVGDVLETANANISSLTTSMAKIDVTLLNGVRKNSNNATTFTFSGLNNITSTSMYRYALLLGGSGGNAYFGHVFCNTDGTVTITDIVNNFGRTVSGSISGSNLVITTSSTAYGGFRLIWLN